MQKLTKIVYLAPDHPVAVQNGNCGFNLIEVKEDRLTAVVESVMSFIHIDRTERFEVKVKDFKD